VKLLLKLMTTTMVIFAANVGACIPCDKDASMYVFKATPPKFPIKLFWKQEFGHVRFKVEESNGVENKITILNIQPSNVPLHSIQEMLAKTQFRISVIDGHHSSCVKSFELQMDFPLPQENLAKFEVDISLPKIEISQ